MPKIATEPLFYIFFVYGLSFLIMANLLANEITSARPMKLLSSFWMLVLFGLTHGMTELTDWVRFIGKTLMGKEFQPLLYVSQIMLVISFVFLFQFAVNLMSYQSEKKGIIRSIPFVLFLVFITIITVQGISNISEIGLFARYSFGFGGSLLSGFGLFKLGGTMKAIGNKKLVNGLYLAAFGFICYAVFGGLIVTPVLGMPVQLFRAASAVIITAACYMIVDVFKLE